MCASGREPNSILIGDDCLCSEPCRATRQCFLAGLAFQRGAMSHFCNACPKNCGQRRMGGRYCPAGPSSQVDDGTRSADLPKNLRAIEQQTSAAAEVACAESPLKRFLLRPKRSACSSAIEDFQSPQHHDGGRYQRGHRQHTLQGSDSHPTLRFPSPIERSS